MRRVCCGECSGGRASEQPNKDGKEERSDDDACLWAVWPCDTDNADKNSQWYNSKNDPLNLPKCHWVG